MRSFIYYPSQNLVFASLKYCCLIATGNKKKSTFTYEASPCVSLCASTHERSWSICTFRISVAVVVFNGTLINICTQSPSRIKILSILCLKCRNDFSPCCAPKLCIEPVNCASTINNAVHNCLGHFHIVND